MIRFPAGFGNEVRIKRYLDYYQAGYGVNAVTSLPAWTPLNLFANGETGGWWDFTNLSTLSQDSAGTTPVTAANDPIGRALDQTSNATNMTQASNLIRPVLGQDALGKYYVQFNGSSTFLEAVYSQTAYPATLVAAMNNTITSANGNGIVSLSQSDVQYKVINELNASGTGGSDRNGTIANTATVAQTGNKVVFVDFSAAAVSMIVNSSAPVSTAVLHAFGATAKIFLGKTRPAGLFSNARLYGALAINRSLTPTERSYLRVYLGSTMGVAL